MQLINMQRAQQEAVQFESQIYNLPVRIATTGFSSRLNEKMFNKHWEYVMHQENKSFIEQQTSL